MQGMGDTALPPQRTGPAGASRLRRVSAGGSNGPHPAISPPAFVQWLFAFVVLGGLLALSVGAGVIAARLQQVNARPPTFWHSPIPLTQTALIALLDPSRMTAGQSAVPIVASESASTPAADSPLPIAPPPAAGTTQGQEGFLPGEPLQVANVVVGGCANLRDTPSLSGQVLRCLPQGTGVQVIAGPQSADGYQWWNVDAGGWVAQDYLAGVPGATAAAVSAPSVQTGTATAAGQLRGYSGGATYYGVEDGFVRGDIMYDGTPYDPANPSITAASFLIPIHTWLLVCTPVRCIVVEVRDRGLLDQNGILLDLSRAAYAQLFGGLGGKQRVSAFFIDPAIVALSSLSSASATP